MKKISFLILSVVLILFACEKEEAIKLIPISHHIFIFNDIKTDTLYVQIRLVPIDTFVVYNGDTLKSVVYGSDSLIVPYYKPDEYTLGDSVYVMVLPWKSVDYQLSPSKSYNLFIYRQHGKSCFPIKENDGKNIALYARDLATTK